MLAEKVRKAINQSAQLQCHGAAIMAKDHWFCLRRAISLGFYDVLPRTTKYTKKDAPTIGAQGYNFCVYNDLQAIGMEHATDIHVELVELVDGLSCSHIPENAIIQYQVVCWVEGGTVPLVVVGQVCVV